MSILAHAILPDVHPQVDRIFRRTAQKRRSLRARLFDQAALVERMKITVSSLQVTRELTRAVVTAVSARRCCGVPQARIELTVRVPTVPFEARRSTAERVRDAALANLGLA